jgi:hypothetical protein
MSDSWGLIYLQFADQNGVPYPGISEFPIRFDNLNVYLKKDRQRLRLPFSFNGSSFVAGGAYQP